jgi:hypothetical protein
MKKQLIGLLLCFCVAPIFGQQVTFNIVPKGAFVRINGEVLNLSEKNSITLPAGTYEAEIWAPRFEVVNKTIELTAGRNEAVNLGLKVFTDGFSKYREKISKYNTDRLSRRLGGGSLVAANAALAYFMFGSQYRKGKKIEDRIAKFQGAYADNTSFIGFGFIRDQYNMALEEHREIKDRHDVRTKIGIPLVGLTAAAATYFFYRQSKQKLVKPKFIPANPFVGALLRVEPNFAFSENQGTVGLTFKF